MPVSGRERWWWRWSGGSGVVGPEWFDILCEGCFMSLTRIVLSFVGFLLCVCVCFSVGLTTCLDETGREGLGVDWISCWLLVFRLIYSAW